MGTTSHIDIDNNDTAMAFRSPQFDQESRSTARHLIIPALGVLEITSIIKRGDEDYNDADKVVTKAERERLCNEAIRAVLLRESPVCNPLINGGAVDLTKAETRMPFTSKNVITILTWWLVHSL